MTTEPKYTDTQIETMAAHLISSTPNWYRESFGDWKDAVHTCDRAPKDAADMLRSLLAERIEADESAMPVATTCAKEVDDNSVSFCCLDWIALAALPTGTELFTHPPAQADYPECSGDPSNCPENEDFGCCMANLPAQLVQGEEVDCPECGTRCTERVIRMSDDVIREYTPVARPAQEQPGWKLLPIEPTMEMVREGLAHSHCPPMNADRLAQIYMAMRRLESKPDFDALAKEQGYDLSISCIGIGYAEDGTGAAKHGWDAALASSQTPPKEK